MDNFLLGLRAVLGELKNTVAHLGNYPLLWGFAFGFLTSTIVHAFLMTEHPGQIRTVLFEDKAKGFEKLFPPKEGGSFGKSYTEYSRMVDRTKITLLSAFLVVTIILLIVALTR